MMATFYILAAMRRGSSSLGVKPNRLQAFTTPDGAQETLKAIVRFAQQAGYKIPAMDEAKGQLVLEEPASIGSITSFGFFFPVFVSRQSDGVTLVEVGIKSKLFQVGSLVSRSHEKCVTGMKAALLAQTVDRLSSQRPATVTPGESPAMQNARESPPLSPPVQATRIPPTTPIQVPEGSPSTSEPTAASEWHVAVGGKSVGPFSPMGLAAMARSGEIAPSTSVWKRGMAEWVRLSDVSDLASALEPPPLPPRAERRS
jgi:hypothetical protein